MHRTILNMSLCMIVFSGLPLRFWVYVVQYASYVLNRSPKNANTGKGSPIRILTSVPPPLNAIAVFGFPYSVYGDPNKNNFAKRANVFLLLELVMTLKAIKYFFPMIALSSQRNTYATSRLSIKSRMNYSCVTTSLVV